MYAVKRGARLPLSVVGVRRQVPVPHLSRTQPQNYLPTYTMEYVRGVFRFICGLNDQELV